MRFLDYNYVNTKKGTSLLSLLRHFYHIALSLITWLGLTTELPWQSFHSHMPHFSHVILALN